MKVATTPLSERVQAGETGPETVREVQALERAAGAGVAYAIANGRGFRGWPLERWLGVLTFTMMLTGSVVGAIWLVSGEWTGMVEKHKAILATMDVIVKRVEIIQTEQQRLREEQIRLLPPVTRQPVARPDPTMTFPRDERFLMRRDP